MDLSRPDDGAMDFSIGVVAKVIRDAVVRDVDQHPERYIDLLESVDHADPAVLALEKVTDGINNGQSLQQSYGDIARLVSNQADRAELFDNLLMTHDFTRLVKFLKARSRVESVLLTIAERGDLTAAESLAFLEMMNNQISKIQTRIRAGTASNNDIMGLLAKVDFAMQGAEEDLEARFAKSTPQGREIMRRLATRLGKLSRSGDSDER